MSDETSGQEAEPGSTVTFEADDLQQGLAMVLETLVDQRRVEISSGLFDIHEFVGLVRYDPAEGWLVDLLTRSAVRWKYPDLYDVLLLPVAAVRRGAILSTSSTRVAASVAEDLDGVTAAVAGFAKAMTENRPALAGLDIDEARQRGVDAARRLIAEHRWAAMVGPTLDTSEVRELLDISRQALEARRRTGSLLGLVAAKGSTKYPAWQFDAELRRVHPVVASIVAAFRNEMESVTEATIVSWASTPQEDLADKTPGQWISEHGDTEQLLRSATRAAAALAQ